MGSGRCNFSCFFLYIDSVPFLSHKAAKQIGGRSYLGEYILARIQIVDLRGDSMFKMNRSPPPDDNLASSCFLLSSLGFCDHTGAVDHCHLMAALAVTCQTPVADDPGP